MVLFVLFCFSSGVETVARLFKPITGRGNAKPSKAIIFHRVPQIKTRHVAKFCRWTSKDFFKTISPQFSKPEFYVRISSQFFSRYVLINSFKKVERIFSALNEERSLESTELVDT